MPTGYTADVQTGTVTDLRTFVLRCARAFGACVLQRDDKMDALPQMREVTPYYTERVEKARAAFDRAATMTEAEAEAGAEADYQQRVAYAKERDARNAEEQGRYAEMLAQVVGWTPPSADHEGLKSFMVEQLRSAQQFDNLPPIQPERLTGVEWLARQRETTARDIAWAEKALREEQERVAGANRWIQALYDSLESVPV